MMDRNSNSRATSGVLLQRLFHLKGYETPDSARMTRNKQNIMRQVREVNIPWFFAEPKYGIAVLFIAFAGLQYLGVATRDTSHRSTGIYTPDNGMAMAGQSTTISTNTVFYPKLPDNLNLFPDQQGDSGVKFVGRLEPKK